MRQLEGKIAVVALITAPAYRSGTAFGISSRGLAALDNS